MLSAAALVAGAVACGLDESGLEGDGGGPDVVGVDVVTPPDAGQGDVVTKDVVNDVVVTDSMPNPCTTLDVSACLDAGIPDGWAPVAVSTTNTTCPADYDTHTYYQSPQLGSGACQCGCTPTGSYSCAGQLAYGGNNCGSCSNGISSCNSQGTFDAGDTTACFTNSLGGVDIAFGAAPTATGNGVGCNATVTGSQTGTTQPVTACAPKCTANYCNVSGFSRCIVSATQTTCPAPFVPQSPIGPNPTPTVTCDTCTCTPTQQGSCGASMTYYSGAGCTNQITGTATFDQCKGTGATKVVSFQYAPTVPTVACTPSTGNGTATLAQPMTLCCLP